MQFILFLIFIILTLGSLALVAFPYMKKKGKSLFIGGIAASVIFFILLFLIPGGFYQVEAGEAALIKEWGNAKSVETAGLRWRFWIKDTVTMYDLKVQEVDTELIAYSQDAQTMSADMVVQYKIMQDKIIDINEEYGSLESLQSRITNVFVEKAKVVLASSSAMNIIENRDNLSASVYEEVNKDAGKYYITLNTVLINDIEFNEAFENAVEQKMIAEQQQLQAEYDKQKAIIKAQEELEVAKLAAEALLASQTAEAEAQKVIAQAQAEAIKLKSLEVARMLGFNILDDGSIDYTGKSFEEISVISEYLKYIEYLEKWDGELPQVMGDSSAVVMPDLN